MVKLWRCEICGDSYIGDSPPSECPFCGAHGKYIREFSSARVDFDVELSEKDLVNVKRALEVELSNTAFYFCASKKVNDKEGKALFKALGKVENEHASIWRKILKLDSVKPAEDGCSDEYETDLGESHEREDRAIDFYRKAFSESENPRIRQIFEALIEVETDHLQLSEERLK